MAYNNNGWNNNGWNNNNRNNQRRNDRDYNNPNNGWGGYPDDRDRYDAPRPFQIGQTVLHTATGIRLIVINYGREQVECRKPDLTSGYFYVHELSPLAEGQQ